MADPHGFEKAAIADARAATLKLLAARAPGATVCPSEVARLLAAGQGAKSAVAEWRGVMPTVHAAVDELLAEESVWLSWKGTPLTTRIGPYRINRKTSG